MACLCEFLFKNKSRLLINFQLLTLVGTMANKALPLQARSQVGVWGGVRFQEKWTFSYSL